MTNQKKREEQIEEDNQLMRRRQEDFQVAAEYVASAFAEVPEVDKIILFGSVAVPLKKEVPRFPTYRRTGTEILHECKDLDLAVWVTDLGCLKSLQKARSQAVNKLFRDKNIGVAHHQVDVFLMEPGTDLYLGRLCIFKDCPKGKNECRVPGCGESRYLQQHESFVFNHDLLKPKRVVFLYGKDRSPAYVR